ncbi:MAG TPA: hypothetical protein VFB06_11145 [Streptosporangiaceae bacterium]|nr:hypothetical protein [Streptosporangiaceae bacterium]
MRGGEAGLLLVAVANAVVSALLAAVSVRTWGVAGVPNGAAAVICIVLWLLMRRRKKRACRPLGAKSRAAIEALARRLRDAAVPGPVAVPA